jgi:hypothetical protein
MVKLTRVSLVLLEMAIGSAVVAGFVATGCSSSTTSTTDSGTGTDTGQTSFDTGTTADAGNKTDTGTTVTDTGADTTMTADSPTDSPPSDSPSDSPSDAPTDSHADAADAGCVTTIAELEGEVDGGSVVPDGGHAPLLLFSFDGVTGSPTGWAETVASQPDGGTFDPTLSSSSIIGHTCPGSMEVTNPFTAYFAKQETSNTQYNYGLGGDGGLAHNWVGYKTLHLWIKVTTTAASYAGLNGVQVFVQSGSDYQHYRSSYYYYTTFTDGAFHHVTQDLTPNLDADAASGSEFDPTQVNDFGVQVQAAGSEPDGGPATPSTFQMYVDDIWLE